LDVIQEFKDCESLEEWTNVPSLSWVKLAQLQDYLRLLTGTEVEKVDDDTAKAFLEKHLKHRF
jgi:hypothetical protein